MKTTSEQFTVKQAPFVVDVYLDGSHENHRGDVAIYACVRFYCSPSTLGAQAVRRPGESNCSASRHRALQCCCLAER